jgi:hypothetical protein
MHNKEVNLPHFVAFEVTAVDIPNRTEALIIGAVYVPPSQPNLAQDPTTLPNSINTLYLLAIITPSIRCDTLD